MRVQHWLLTAALVTVPALAAAQTTTTAPGSTTTTQTTTTTRTNDVDVDFDDLDGDTGGWFASAHVGSDFGEEADGTSVDFGGALGYTSGWFGAESSPALPRTSSCGTTSFSMSRRSTATCST